MIRHNEYRDLNEYYLLKPDSDSHMKLTLWHYHTNHCQLETVEDIFESNLKLSENLEVAIERLENHDKKILELEQTLIEKKYIQLNFKKTLYFSQMSNRKPLHYKDTGLLGLMGDYVK